MYSSFDKEAGFSGSGGTFAAVSMEEDDDSLLLLQLKVDLFLVVVVVDVMVVVLDVPSSCDRISAAALILTIEHQFEHQ
jgi:hypothetical protein